MPHIIVVIILMISLIANISNVFTTKFIEIYFVEIDAIACHNTCHTL